MNRLTDAQLEALYKAIHAESHTQALRAVYEQGILWGQEYPDVVVVTTPDVSDVVLSVSTSV